jgi:hypothetical protein
MSFTDILNKMCCLVSDDVCHNSVSGSYLPCSESRASGVNIPRKNNDIKPN